MAESWQPYRILSVAERDTVNNADGGRLTFTYGHNQTTITDHNGSVEILQFNDLGNTRSIQDDEGHATFADYARNAKDDTVGKANQLKVASKLQNTVANLLQYSSFEAGSNWIANIYPANESILSATRTTETAYRGNYSLKVSVGTYGSSHGAYSPRFDVLPGETVTYSAYVKTPDSTALIALHYNNSSGYYTFTGETLQPSDTWVRTQMQFTNTTSATISMYAYIFTQNPGTYYVDCVQVEKAETASRYNLVVNGDFRYSSANWTKSANCTTTDTHVTLNTGKAPAPQLQDTVFQITGDPQKTKSISQTVTVSGTEGDSFVLAGWAKGHSVPISGDRTFALRACFNYTDGSDPEYIDAEFNTAVDQWQYAAIPMAAKKAYSSVTVSAVYDYNVNTVYFDGIQLFKEEFGSSYTYDDKGNVISVVDLQKQTTSYEYNTAGDLTKILQDNKAKVTYTYDSYHNVKTATTEEGLVYSFDYDSYGNNTKVTIGSGDKTISSSATYSPDGNLLISTTDALAKVTNYGYNEDTGVQEWVQYPEDTEATRTEYTYDSMYRMAQAECTTDTGLNQSVSYQYENDRLMEIDTPTTAYLFGYSAFGQRSVVAVHAFYLLAMYEYTEDANRYLRQLTYGNDDTVNYTYDQKGRLLTQTYEDGDTVSYSYDNNGALATVKDSATGRTTTYYYDLTDRMMKYVEKGTNYAHSVGYEYDIKNNLTQLVETINGTTLTSAYTYDDDNRVKTVTTDGVTVEYFYDTNGRVERQETRNGSTVILTESFTYVTPTAAATSSQIAAYTTTAPGGYSVTYTYTYDDNGNITSIFDGTHTVSYEYDSANQLIYEENPVIGSAFDWEYDNAGNIVYITDYYYNDANELEAIGDHVYEYQDDFWGDLLTKYDGSTITRDNIGNPLSDGEWTYTWEHGRQLASMSKGTTTWTYQYNADGIRTQKSNGTDTYSYVYNGSQLTKGTDTLYFTYDASGTPLTVKYNGTTYYYATNIQGDVVAILNNSGTAVVTYSYNAWGEAWGRTGSMEDTLGIVNPLRYRGYVYDQETGLYYLQSRYYDSEICRFINADNYPTTGQGFVGNNMFAYCGNNPVMRIDVSGEFFNTICGALVGGIISVLTVDKNGAETWQQAFTRGAVTGAIAGAGLDICIATGGTGAALIIAGVAGSGASMIDTAWEAGNNGRSTTPAEVISNGLIGGGLNVLFGASGREVTNAVGNTVTSVGAAIVKNTLNSVTNRAGKVVVKKVVSEFAKNTAYSSLQAAAGKVYSLISSKMREILGG